MTTKITDKNISNLANIGVQWQSVFTGDGSTGLTAVAGRGYFINTTSGTVTVTLPASPSAGDVVVLKDYARTWGTNAVSIASALFDGDTLSNSFSTNGQTVTLVYMDGTKGWSLVNEDTTTSLGAQFISATGGTITQSGDFQIHTFTGDGCFVVSSLGAGIPCVQASTVDYLVVAGGGGGGRSGGGGAGAGGYRESKDSTLSSPHTASPLAATTGLTITATTYPITVGGGGAGLEAPSGLAQGVSGSNSVFSTITSAGGSGGGSGPQNGSSIVGGGSGGGGRANQANPVGAGNTPPVSPPQGNQGGIGGPATAGGGGGGASASGCNASGRCAGDGADGVSTSITGSSVTRAGGGGGGTDQGTPTPGSPGDGGVGGNGGGGRGGIGTSACGPTAGVDGTTNTGGGGGGGSNAPAWPGNPTASGGSGGKGIVIIRYKYQ